MLLQEQISLITGPRNSATSLLIGQRLRQMRSAAVSPTCRPGKRRALSGSSSAGPTPSSKARPPLSTSSRNCAKPWSCPAVKASLDRWITRRSRASRSGGSADVMLRTAPTLRRTSGRGVLSIHIARHDMITFRIFGRISSWSTSLVTTPWHRTNTSIRLRFWNANLPILSSSARVGHCQLVRCCAEQLLGQASVSAQKSSQGNASSIARSTASACPALSRSSSVVSVRSSAMRVRNARLTLLPSWALTWVTRRLSRSTSTYFMCRISRINSL
mmetsp:Transcript_26356/g.61871  ORF Transcript_26356/g.61871 Transcript_26356/m.61871 type:complete len:273 (-) Transcript_26356:333-1151(-)